MGGDLNLRHIYPRVSALWSRARDGLWFVPAVLVTLAVVLSVVFLYLDRTIPTIGTWLWFSDAKATAAREILSVTAGSLITVISVAFSVTIIALQQSATQYSPRILRNFTRDRGNQIVLGTYIATFAYSILVLREVRDSGDSVDGFVPALSVTMAMVFAMVSLGLLIYFIHHIAQSLQVPFVLQSIRDELDPQMESLYPSAVGEPQPLSPSAGETVQRLRLNLIEKKTLLYEVRAKSEGYLNSVDEEQLEKLCRRGISLLWIPVQVGTYVFRQQVIARFLCDDKKKITEFDESIGFAMIFSPRRSMQQDILFGIEQMVEIGVKALSPGINDPTTAKQSLNAIVGVLGLLIRRDFPSPARRLKGGNEALFARPVFSNYVDTAFSQLRWAARSDYSVTTHILDVIASLGEMTSQAERVEPLRVQVHAIEVAAEKSEWSQGEVAELKRRAAQIMREWAQ